jgi:HEAT repeat protein
MLLANSQPLPTGRAAALACAAALLVGASALAQGFADAGFARDLGKLSRFVQTTSSSDEAKRAFARGRDLLAEEEWARAAEQFGGFVKEYPRHKDVDAALYWLAFSQKKQNRFQDADATIERLLGEYPKSKWRDDAEALRLEIAPQLGKRETIQQAINKEDEEMKMIALQSLFQASPERAAAIVADILKPDSKASPRLRETALSLLMHHGGERGLTTLIEIARGGGDVKLRQKAVFWLGQTRDERALDVLKEIATKADDPAAKQAAFAISQHGSARATALLAELARTAASRDVRKQAVFGLGQRRGDEALDALFALYGSEQDVEVRKQILFAVSQTQGDRGQAKLLEIARAEKDLALRKQAIFSLTQMRGDAAVPTLVQLYDAEQNPQVKEYLLSAFGQSRSPEARRKLMQIAKSDASVETRKKAVFWLGQSRDPEVLKFLEELLK